MKGLRMARYFRDRSRHFEEARSSATGRSPLLESSLRPLLPGRQSPFPIHPRADRLALARTRTLTHPRALHSNPRSNKRRKHAHRRAPGAARSRCSTFSPRVIELRKVRRLRRAIPTIWLRRWRSPSGLPRQVTPPPNREASPPQGNSAAHSFP